MDVGIGAVDFWREGGDGEADVGAGFLAEEFCHRGGDGRVVRGKVGDAGGQLIEAAEDAAVAKWGVAAGDFGEPFGEQAFGGPLGDGQCFVLLDEETHYGVL